MSVVKVPIHAVWRTKNNYPFLTDEIRIKVCKHIFAEAKKKKIIIDTIDGYTEHLHCLFYLKSTITIMKVLQFFKGESSKWINDNLRHEKKFAWADDYFATAVCEQRIETVRNYIKNQKKHHTKVTFKQEYEDFLKAINWKGEIPD